MDASDSIFNVSSLLDSSKDGDTDPDKSSSPKSISISKSMSKVACMLRNNNRRRSNSFLLEESGEKAFEEEETLDFDDCEIVVEEDSLSYDYKQEMNTVIEEAAAKLIHNNEVTARHDRAEMYRRVDQTLEKDEETMKLLILMMSRVLKEEAHNQTETDFGIDVIDVEDSTDDDSRSHLILDIDPLVTESPDTSSGASEGPADSDTQVLVLINSLPSFAFCGSDQIEDSSSSLEVRFRGSQTVMTVPRHHVALHSPPSSPVQVGSRVLAKYQASWVLGVIAEPAKLLNRYRTLVFLITGQSVYVKNDDLRTFLGAGAAVSEPNLDGFPELDHTFIKQYLANYPENPFKKLREGDDIKLHADDKWWNARVEETDSSLIRVSYSNGSQEEWIFRGSHRIGGSNSGSSRPLRFNINDPEVKQTRGSFAKKSTAKKSPVENLSTGSTNNTDVLTPAAAEGNIVQVFHQPVPGLEFRPHVCSPTCVSSTQHNFNAGNVKIAGQPLMIPLQWGWSRQLVKHSNYGFTKVSRSFLILSSEVSCLDLLYCAVWEEAEGPGGGPQVPGDDQAGDGGGLVHLREVAQSQGRIQSDSKIDKGKLIYLKSNVKFFS